MQLDRGDTAPAATMLGAAGAFGAFLWVVPLYLLAQGSHPDSAGLAVLLFPSALGTAALAFAGGLWLGRQCRTRQDEETLAAGQSRLALADAQLRLAAQRAEVEARRITRLLEAAAPGAALFDAGQTLVAWNRGFAPLLELPAPALRVGLPLAELAQMQPAGLGRRLPLRSIETGIAGAAWRQRGDGSQVEDRWSPAEDGELLLTAFPVLAPGRDAPLPAGGLAALCEEEVRSRLPRLQAAIAAADTGAVRVEAHAMRGVVAGFGLHALAEALGTVEAAARAGDMAGLVATGPGLQPLAEAALRQLGQPVA